MTIAARRAPSIHPPCDVVALEDHRPASPVRFDRETVARLCDREGAEASSLLGTMLALLADRVSQLRAAWRDAPQPDHPPLDPRAAVDDLALVARTLGLTDLEAACIGAAAAEGRADAVARAACRDRLLRHADLRGGRGWEAMERSVPP